MRGVRRRARSRVGHTCPRMCVWRVGIHLGLFSSAGCGRVLALDEVCVDQHRGYLGSFPPAMCGRLRTLDNVCGVRGGDYRFRVQLSLARFRPPGLAAPLPPECVTGGICSTCRACLAGLYGIGSARVCMYSTCRSS